MALKAAMYELTGGDEKAAELAQPMPGRRHVPRAHQQFTVMSRIQDRIGIRFVHATDMEDGFAAAPGTPATEPTRRTGPRGGR
ncbi:hypothetical protein [Streptomyces avermitilis]|uniref:hypothetical protein n=1 Tax=Streptomyces avermitilis TaxID=33903 RepID=UPI0036CEC611